MKTVIIHFDFYRWNRCYLPSRRPLVNTIKGHKIAIYAVKKTYNYLYLHDIEKK